MSSEDGITVRQNLQITSATKSTHKRHRRAGWCAADFGIRFATQEFLADSRLAAVARRILQIMRLSIRWAIGWAAIYAVALHVILLGLVPIAATGSTLDPFSVICHSATDTGGGVPINPGLIPGHACEHCNLCSAVAPPPAPNVALSGSMGPTRVLHVLRPVSAAPAAGLVFRPNLARGPPQFV